MNTKRNETLENIHSILKDWKENNLSSKDVLDEINDILILHLQKEEEEMHRWRSEQENN